MSHKRMLLIRWLKRNKDTISIELEQQGGAERLSDPQWIWKSLVGSMATWGSSRGHERLTRERDAVWNEIGFEALTRIPESEAFERLKRVMERVNPRYANNKG